jgi:hypothetical protein
VRDTQAEQTLGKVHQDVRQVLSEIKSVAGSTGVLGAMKQDLYSICLDTRGSSFAECR